MRFSPFGFLGQEFFIDYIIVGGGARGALASAPTGGGSGAVISGSLTTSQGDVFNIIVGAGGNATNPNGETSSLQIKSTTTYYAPGGNAGTSGNGFPSGSSISCAALTVYGGGGSAKFNGNSGICNPFPTQTPGYGGDGTPWLDGNYYGGGGGAGNSSNTGITKGLGGIGGGGNGGTRTEGIGLPVPATSGINGFGGGGGGQGRDTDFPPGNGGTGSVIIRYPAPQRAYGGDSVFESGSYVYHTFVTNGTLTT